MSRDNIDDAAGRLAELLEEALTNYEESVLFEEIPHHPGWAERARTELVDYQTKAALGGDKT